jgi:hypothetical protein
MLQLVSAGGMNPVEIRRRLWISALSARRNQLWNLNRLIQAIKI